MTDRESDSFIREVTEEVRRDQLFDYWKKYGLYAVAAIVLIVGTAGWWTWQQNAEREAAQALGTSFIEASAADDPAAAFAALGNALEGDTAAVARLSAATAHELAGEIDAALEAYLALAADGSAPDLYGHAAAIAAARLSEDAPVDERIALLEPATVPGAPYRLIALEVRAGILLGAGRQEEAWADLRQVISDSTATRGSVVRSTQLLLASGGTIE